MNSQESSSAGVCRYLYISRHNDVEFVGSREICRKGGRGQYRSRPLSFQLDNMVMCLLLRTAEPARHEESRANGERGIASHANDMKYMKCMKGTKWHE